MPIRSDNRGSTVYHFDFNICYRYSSTQRDAFPFETDAVAFNKDDETRHPKRDYFAPDTDGNELNGTLSSQVSRLLN